MRYLVIWVVLVVLFLNNWALAGGRQDFAIPSQYTLSFDDALKLVNGHLIIKCVGVNSRYATDGTGYGISGQGTMDSWIGTRTFQVYVNGWRCTVSTPEKTTLKWYSSLTKESGSASSFITDSKLGLNHIYVASYRNGKKDMAGNYYLKVVPAMTEKERELLIPKGRAKRLMHTLVQGTMAEAMFQISSTWEKEGNGNVAFDAKLAKVEGGAKVSHASTKANTVRVRVQDDGKSLMFPSRQPVTVLTIKERTYVDTAGKVKTEVKLEKSEDQLLTITKVRPKNGRYEW